MARSSASRRTVGIRSPGRSVPSAICAVTCACSWANGGSEDVGSTCSMRLSQAVGPASAWSAGRGDGTAGSHPDGATVPVRLRSAGRGDRCRHTSAPGSARGRPRRAYSAPMSLTWARALAWRLRRHELAPPGDAPVEGVVDRLVALVARSEPAAELSVRLRQRDSRPGQLGAALVDGRVVKTYAFRGATHLMTPEQAATHLALRTASRMWELPSWQEFYRLTPTDWPDLRDAVRDALAAGPLTRAELGEAVAAEPRFAHLRAAIAEGQDTLVKPLAWHGVLSFGPSRAGRVTFAALEANPRWPGLPDLDRSEERRVGKEWGSGWARGQGRRREAG